MGLGLFEEISAILFAHEQKLGLDKAMPRSMTFPCVFKALLNG
jgi:hypothetical protein